MKVQSAVRNDISPTYLVVLSDIFRARVQHVVLGVKSQKGGVFQIRIDGQEREGPRAAVQTVHPERMLLRRDSRRRMR